jgi:hypothetical protein
MIFAWFVFGIRDCGAEIRSIGFMQSIGDNLIEDSSEENREKGSEENDKQSSEEESDEKWRLASIFLYCRNLLYFSWS